MLRITSKGTYQVLKQILIDQKFTQNELVHQTELTKGRISQIVNWLTDKEFLIRNGRLIELVDHSELLRLFFLLRDMKPVFRIKLDVRDVEDLTNSLNDLEIVLCESSALCFYDLYCVHRELDFYINKENLSKAKKRLKKMQSGNFEVKIYLSDIPIEKDINYIGSQRITGEIRTVIDMHSLGKAAESRSLMSKIWPID